MRASAAPVFLGVCKHLGFTSFMTPERSDGAGILGGMQTFSI